MRKMKFIVLGLLCFAVSTANAQLPKASDYFPLQSGNMWEFDHPYQTQFQLLEVVSDTRLADSVVVYKVDRKSKKFWDDPWITGAPYYYHYNEDSTIIYRDAIAFPQEPYAGLPIIDTGHGLRHTWQYLVGDCFCTFSVTDTGSAQFFNQSMQWLDVNIINPDYDSLVISMELYRFIAGIGPFNEGPDTLIYAKINDIEYGMPTGIYSGYIDNPAVPNDLSLQVYPNPVIGNSTITLNSKLRQVIDLKVIDVLGRTVRLFNIQSHFATPIQIHWDGNDTNGNALPNGIYFITARTGEIIKSQKIIYLR